jgi:hypothetical protein
MQKFIIWHIFCVNTLPATKVSLITDAIYFGSLREKIYGDHPEFPAPLLVERLLGRWL